MFGANKPLNAQEQRMNGSDLYIAIVQARFNESITNELARACKDELTQLGVKSDRIHHITVPGALEIPVALQALAERDEFDALIALGCIIRGETYHFEVVANEMAAGINRVALDYKTPIANEVLTVENVNQALARQEDKGRDAAQVAVEMANLINGLN